MKKLHIFFILAWCSIAPCSCKKWLDVQPEDKFTESQIFNSKATVFQALNGVYLTIAKPSMYGAALTMVVPEVLAQRYNIGSMHDYYVFTTYNYTDKDTKATMELIWSNTYVAIANLNSFLQQLDKYKGVLTPSQDSLVRGEAYGLRAFLHFDMLRLFGPMYNSPDSLSLSIPYYRTLSTNYNPYLPAKNVLDSILADINVSASLLANDPVIAFGPKGNPDPMADDFFKDRNLRMNFFAVKALQARVNMYKGDKVAAYDDAQFIIQKAQSFFPWIVPSAVLSNKDNADRIFSTELIFALQSMDLYNSYTKYYGANLDDQSILAPVDARLKTTYEDPTNINDYRYNPCWYFSNASNKSYRTFYKYAEPLSSSMPFKYMMPMLRMSEMYYIAAECAPDNTTAFNYLNIVRNNRGLANIPVTAALASELRKEYLKEFFGEGQLFYYYKRTNATSIPNGAAASGNVTMNKTKYVVPMPESETNYH